MTATRDGDKRRHKGPSYIDERKRQVFRATSSNLAEYPSNFVE